MEIDNMQGKVTTTGTMDKGPAMPKGKVNPVLPTQKKEIWQIFYFMFLFSLPYTIDV